jgi:hypothetical protein
MANSKTPSGMIYASRTIFAGLGKMIVVKEPAASRKDATTPNAARPRGMYFDLNHK